MSLPERVGRYRIVRRLGLGGMAEVLLGVLDGSHNVSRPVVIKRILEHHREREDFQEMFVDEARILSSLHHPNIVSVIELGSDEGHLFIAMEYLDGEPLSDLLKALGDARLPPTLAAHVGAEACAALQAAHEHRDESGAPSPIVHRDISPDNVFLSRDGGVTLIDFGIAKSPVREHATTVGVIKGKLLYMAPEQLRRKATLDHRADLFALCATLVRATTGGFVYPNRSEVALLGAIQAGEVDTARLDAPGYPPGLAAILRKGLDPDPDGRYQSAGAMRAALVGWLRREAPTEDLRATLAGAVRRATGEGAIASDDFLTRVDEPAMHTESSDARTRRLDDPLPPVGPATEFAVAPAEPAVVPPPPGAGLAEGGPLETVQLEDLGQPTRRPWLAIASLVALAAVAVGVALSLGDPPAAPTPAATPLANPTVRTTPQEPIEWQLRTQPAGVSVYLEGELLGRTPLRVERAPEEGKAELTFRHEGYQPLVAEVDRSRDVLLDRALEAEEEAEVEPEPPPTRRRRRAPRMRSTMAEGSEMAGGGFFRVD